MDQPLKSIRRGRLTPTKRILYIVRLRGACVAFRTRFTGSREIRFAEKEKRMFKEWLLTVVVLLAWGPPGSHALEISGVEIPETIQAGDTTLVLNGAGIRTKLMMDMYAAGLYLEEKSRDAQRIIDADEPMGIRLHILSKLISSRKMSAATEEGFEVSTGGNTAPIRKEIDAFISVFKSEIRKNDVYELVYIPGKGVEASKNGTLLVTIPGLELKRAMFGIWLCKNPSHKNPALKAGMLGE